jgi:ADP-ribose pyrophosphatase YjhB (NUDIX family)
MSQWLDWAKQLQALSQTGLAYSKDKYDIQRFEIITQISHQMMAELSDSAVERVDNLFIPETGYPTPKVDVRAAVIKNNKILLVREREDNLWTLPGGWADTCETPSEGVIREVFEESGFIVDKPRLIAIKDRAIHPYEPLFPFHIYKFFYLCNYIGGSPTINIEISEIDFFSRDHLPALSTSRVLPADIEMAFDYYTKPDKLAYTD